MSKLSQNGGENAASAGLLVNTLRTVHYWMQTHDPDLFVLKFTGIHLFCWLFCEELDPTWETY